MKNLDLTKILKVGDRVYSTILGYGVVKTIDLTSQSPIHVEFNNNTRTFTEYGCYYQNVGECVLFPSKEIRDWNEFLKQRSFQKEKNTTNLNLTKILQVGDHVYSLIQGEGVVKEIKKNYTTYCLTIAFEKSPSATYTKDGKYYSCEGETVLFPSKEERSWDRFIHSKPYISTKEFIGFLKNNGAYEKFLMNRCLPTRINKEFISSEFIWENTPEGNSFWADIDRRFVKLFTLNSASEKWTVVQWPEIQNLMDLEGFEDNAYLINDEKGLNNFGSSAYFVNENWLKTLNLES